MNKQFIDAVIQQYYRGVITPKELAQALDEETFVEHAPTIRLAMLARNLQDKNKGVSCWEPPKLSGIF